LIRAALFLWKTPLLAAISTLLVTSLKKVRASSDFPLFKSARNFFTYVLVLDFTLLLRNLLFSLFRKFFHADLVFGILPPLIFPFGVRKTKLILTRQVVIWQYFSGILPD